MLNLTNAEDAYLDGNARFEEWLMGFDRDWYLPVGQSLLATALGTMSKEQLAQLAGMDPANLQGFMNQLGGGNYANNYTAARRAGVVAETL